MKRLMEYVDGEQSVINRIVSTAGTVSLQSDVLQKTASKLARKLLMKAGYMDLDLPDFGEVEIAATTIKKLANANQIDLSEVNKIIKQIKSSNRLNNIPLLEEV